MNATGTAPETSASNASADPLPPPFALEFVTITKQEQIQLKMAALQWQTLHRKAVARCEQQEVRHDRLVRELKAQALKSNAALQSKLDFALAQVRDLQKRLFSTKSEQANPSESRSRAATCRKRGQQRGTVGHGRTIESQLSERHEDIVLEKPQCPECGLAIMVSLPCRLRPGFPPAYAITAPTPRPHLARRKWTKSFCFFFPKRRVLF